MSYFVYDGTSIKTLLPGSELTIGVLDSFDEIDGNLGREIIKGEVNSERYSPNYITSLFNEVVNFDLFIYKTNESDFTTDEQRKLTKLLTNARTPKWFSSYDCNDNLIANYRGLFTQVTYKIFSGLKGFQVHFENDSPYDYDIVKDKDISVLKDFTLNQELKTISFPIESDTDEIIYPVLKITGKTGKTITIAQTIAKCEFGGTNTMFGETILETNTMSFLVTASPFYIDCKRCLVRAGSDYLDYKTIKLDPTKQKWFRLFPNAINTFSYKENDVGEFKTDIDFITADYIVPQKRAIRWE